MKTLIKYLRHRFALSEKGAKDMIVATVGCALKNIIVMVPVSLLFLFVNDILKGTLAGHTILYVVGIVVCLVLIFLAELLEYNTCYFSTYKESGVRRIALAERLRKLPLSFFAVRSTSSILASSPFR